MSRSISNSTDGGRQQAEPSSSLLDHSITNSANAVSSRAAESFSYTPATDPGKRSGRSQKHGKKGPKDKAMLDAWATTWTPGTITVSEDLYAQCQAPHVVLISMAPGFDARDMPLGTCCIVCGGPVIYCGVWPEAISQ